MTQIRSPGHIVEKIAASTPFGRGSCTSVCSLQRTFETAGLLTARAQRVIAQYSDGSTVLSTYLLVEREP